MTQQPEAPNLPAPLLEDDDPTSLQRALASVLAHELRTPLTTIFGGAQLVADPGVSTTTRTEAAQCVAREARRLHAIVEDLLVIVRPDPPGTVEIEPVLLGRLIESVAESRRSEDGRPLVSRSLSEPTLLVLADYGALRRVLESLVDEAVRATPAGGTVAIAARRAEDAVEITISDDGPARTTADAGGAFELFHRSPRMAGDPSGANLPMVASSLLVERMGGRIWAASGEPGGRIGIALPAAVDEERAVSRS